MATNRRRPRPTLGVERLEERIALTTTATAMPTATAVNPPSVVVNPPVVGADLPTIATLDAFTESYRSKVGARYNPAFDLNHNGQVGQADGKILLKSLPALAPASRPLTLNVRLAPGDQARGHVPTNLGGTTPSQDPTVLGHTFPGALVFIGTGTVDLRLTGPAAVADLDGNFSVRVLMTDGINQVDFQAVDPYGRQLLLAFPTRWLGFAAYENAHPRKT